MFSRLVLRRGQAIAMGSPLCCHTRHCSTNNNNNKKVAAADESVSVVKSVRAALSDILSQRIEKNGSGKPIKKYTLYGDVMRAVASRHKSVKGPEFDAVWGSLSKLYYSTNIGGEEYIVPCDWEVVLRGVAQQVPVEGVTEERLGTLIRRQSSHLPASLDTAVVTGTSFAKFVQTYFSHLFLVTRSNVSGRPLYHLRHHNTIEETWSGESHEAQSLQRAVHALGLSKQIPVWVEVHTMEPLLPSRTTAIVEKDGWSGLLGQPSVANCFQVGAFLSVRLSSSRPVKSLVILDVSAFPDATKREEVLTKAGVTPGEYQLKLLTPAEMVKTVEAVPSAEDVETVVVDSLLSPCHMVGALINHYYTSQLKQKKETSSAATTTASVEMGEEDGEEESRSEIEEEEGTTPTVVSPSIVVLCGADAREAFMENISEARPPGVQVRLISEDGTDTIIKDEAE